MGPTVVDDAFAHHVWATLRLIDTCAGLTEVQLATNVPGTYGSIIATLRHIVAADTGYLNLLTDGRVAEIDEQSGTPAELTAIVESVALAWRELLAGNPDPGTIVARHRDDGSESRVALGLRLAQVVHHGTDHRSQVCTALTSIGVEPPGIDVWSFAADMGRIEIVEPASS